MPFMANLATCETKVGTWVSSGSDPGSKECVPAVKALAGTPATSAWRRGKKVKGNNILPGTAIATFPIKKNGKFHFKGHAAIFVRYIAGGFEVYDQWAPEPNEPPKYWHPFQKRSIDYRCWGYVSNDAEAFYVIELTEHPSDDPALCRPRSSF